MNTTDIHDPTFLDKFFVSIGVFVTASFLSFSVVALALRPVHPYSEDLEEDDDDEEPFKKRFYDEFNEMERVELTDDEKSALAEKHLRIETDDGEVVIRYNSERDSFDYWCDNSKLDSQIKLIEQYGADLVFHAYYEVNGKTIDIKRPFGGRKRKVSFWELRRKTPNSAPLATLCLRTASLRTLNSLVPDFLEIYMSHSTTQVAGFLRSKAIYDPKPMSAYRKGVPQSWTQRTNADKNLRKLYVQRYRAAYKALLSIAPINVAMPIRLSLLRLSLMDVIRTLKKFLQVKKF